MVTYPYLDIPSSLRNSQKRHIYLSRHEDEATKGFVELVVEHSLPDSDDIWDNKLVGRAPLALNESLS
jgi:hypothetical protein